MWRHSSSSADSVPPPGEIFVSRAMLVTVIGAVFRGGLKNGVLTTVAGTRWRTASTVTSTLELGAWRGVRRRDRCQRDHLLQDRRPRGRRRAADLAADLVHGHGDARRGGRHLRRQTDVVVQRFDRGPADVEADNLPGRAAAMFLGERLSGRRTAACPSWTSRPSPISNGVYFWDSISAFLLLLKSTSMSRRPASTRATSSASMPAGWMSYGRPPDISASQTAVARSHGIQIS